MRIQAAGFCRESAAAFPVARIRGEEPQVGKCESIHLIQTNSARRRDVEGIQVLAKELDGCQRVKREMIRGRDLDRALRGHESTAKRIRKQIESVCIFLLIDELQHGPGIGITWFFADGAFQGRSRRRMLLGTDALKMRKAPEYRLIGA